MGIKLNKIILFVSFIRFLGNHKMINCILFIFSLFLGSIDCWDERNILKKMVGLFVFDIFLICKQDVKLNLLRFWFVITFMSFRGIFHRVFLKPNFMFFSLILLFYPVKH